MSSLDGNDPPVEFKNHYLPYMIQSPIFANIAILSTAHFQAASRNIEWNKSVDVMGARYNLVTMINEYLAAHESNVVDEAIASVASLAFNEVAALVPQPIALLKYF